MSEALIRTLLLDEVVSGPAFERALFRSLESDVSVVRALVDGGALGLDELERTLRRDAGAAIAAVDAHDELVARLPPGACQRLLAVPVGALDDDGAVTAAVLDPRDAHGPSELSFHLGAPVVVVRAPPRALFAALDALGRASDAPVSPWRRKTDPFGARPSITPPWGTTLPPSEPPSRPSNAPIPLVRLQAGRPEEPFLHAPTTRFRRVPSSLPPRSPAAARHDTAPWGSTLPERDRAEAREVTSARELLVALARTGDRDDVLRLVLAAASTVSRSAVLFVVRRGRLVGWGASGAAGSLERVRALDLPLAGHHALSRALVDGYFFGALALSAEHGPLLEVLGPAAGEHAIWPVAIGDRAVAALVAAGLDDAASATKLIETTTALAGRTLARIAKKR